MDILKIRKNKSIISLIKLNIKFVFALGVAIISVLFIHNIFLSYLNIYHTILELVCIFIGLSIFVSTWYTYDICPRGNRLLGFGYLTVAIFDSLHTFYFLRLNLDTSSYFDLSTRYWILGRLTQGLILLLFVRQVKINKNKGINLFAALVLTLGITFIVTRFHNYIPILLTTQGVTPVKVVLEYIVIILYILSLIKIRKRINDRDIITYKYIFIALLLSSVSEVCFTIYSSVDNVSWTIGHVVRIIAYYFVFRGIFTSAITFPYEKLEVEREKLKDTNGELNDIRQTLQDILDAIPIAVQTCDLENRLKFVNKKYEELLECRREDVCGLTSEELLKMFPMAEKNEKSILYENLENQYDMVNEIRTYKTFQGNHIKLSLKSQRINNGVLTVFSDAKEQQELKNLHIQTEMILNAVSNCVLMIDKSHKIILCNKALEDLLRMDKRSLLGKDIDEINKLVDFSNLELPNLMLSRGNDKELYEESLITTEGYKKELIIYTSPIENVDGEIIGGIGVITDTTEIKKKQQKMMQQEKLALLGQMGAAIVHETRNYLTTIKGRCQLIELFAQSENVKKHAAKINVEVGEVNRIISEFLFLSKPKETELEEISMFDIFESIESMVKTSSLVKGVDVDIELSKEERYLMCDEAQLKQVILNLCKNAVDAMEEKEGAKITIKTGFRETTNEMFISIADNGKGIAEGDLKKIGTPFFTTKDTGTGLGLSVCYKIISEHNGRMEVESELGEGTVFTIILPYVEDNELDEVM